MSTMLFPSVAELADERRDLLASLRITEDELRERASRELLTGGERQVLRRLDQIAFLLGAPEGE